MVDIWKKERKLPPLVISRFPFKLKAYEIFRVFSTVALAAKYALTSLGEDDRSLGAVVGILMIHRHKRYKGTQEKNRVGATLGHENNS